MIKNKNTKKKQISKLNFITQNKRAKHEYFIEQEFEAGILLQGWEVKSLRAHKVDISNSYVSIKNEEAYLLGGVFQPLINTCTYEIYNPTRTRKLLLNRRELNLLLKFIIHKHYTIVVLTIYWKNIWAKVKIGIAKGKKKYDKRISFKEREWAIKKERILKIY